jgi:hypothetical protein
LVASVAQVHRRRWLRSVHSDCMGCGIEPRKVRHCRGRGFLFARRQHVRHRSSKRGIWPGFAPMPIPSAETEPSACAGAETNAPAAEASIMALNDRVILGDFLIEASRETGDTRITLSIDYRNFTSGSHLILRAPPRSVMKSRRRICPQRCGHDTKRKPTTSRRGGCDVKGLARTVDPPLTSSVASLADKPRSGPKADYSPRAFKEFSASRHSQPGCRILSPDIAAPPPIRGVRRR